MSRLEFIIDFIKKEWHWFLAWGTIIFLYYYIGFNNGIIVGVEYIYHIIGMLIGVGLVLTNLIVISAIKFVLQLADTIADLMGDDED